MRRFLLTLTLLSVPCWSQPASQQPAQPPIVVNLDTPIVVKQDTPPTNPWAHLVEIVVPGIIGAGIAFLGVWWTNKRNAAENAANRQHALDIEKIKDKIAAEAKSRDNRWEFHKNTYIGLITAIEQVLSIMSECCVLMSHNLPLPPDHLQRIHESIKQFSIAANLAPLAVSKGLLPLIKSTLSKIPSLNEPTLPPNFFESVMSSVYELREALQEAGRKDLWDTPETESKDEGTT
jgi:hypothetical protein